MVSESERSDRSAEWSQQPSRSTISSQPDFDRWAAAVRQQMLAVLDKRRQQ